MRPQALQPDTWLPGNLLCTFTSNVGESAGSSGMEWLRGGAGGGRALGREPEGGGRGVAEAAGTRQCDIRQASSPWFPHLYHGDHDYTHVTGSL